MSGALDGFTVVDLTTGAAGAMATMFLSDHGARVIRVVGADVAALRDGGYVIWDRGKECVRIDLGQVDASHVDRDASTQAFVRLVESADVLVEDFGPSNDGQRIVEYRWLRQLNSRLVACSITAYGMRGPWKDEPAIDELVLARVGVLASMPGFRPAPVHVVHPLPTVGAAILAALGVSAALYTREVSGQGRKVETSLMAGALLYHPKAIGENFEPYVFQTHPAGSAPFYSGYECADGNWVQLGCVHAGFVASAARVTGLTEKLADPRFADGRPPDPDDALDLRALLAGIIRSKPYAAWAAVFEEADVPFARARWTDESFEDPQITHNEMVIELDDPVHGRVTQMGVALKMSETVGRVQGQRQDSRDLPDGDFKTTGRAGDRELAVDGSETGTRILEPPLADVRVLEITNLIAGPTAGRLLADLGAEVTKIEPPSGDISRPLGRTYFYGVNFNKRSACIDTRTADGKTVVQRLAARSDILLANLRPQATERMGIGPTVNPRLIEVHLTGYGWSGPYSKRPGIDPLASAYLGLLRAQGGRENPPVFPAELAPTDFTTGAVGALGAVLCLLTRRRSGIVQRAESNLLNGAILLCSEWFSRYPGRPERPLADKEQLGLNACHRLFEVADGWIYVVADRAEERLTLRNVFGCGENALAENFAELTVAECLERLAKASVSAAPVLLGNSDVFLNTDHAFENEMVARCEHPTGGEMRVAWNAINFAETKMSSGRPTPLLGEHTREVLEEAGFTMGEIERLCQAGVVKTE